MSNYRWVHSNGEIIEESKDEQYYKLTPADLKEVLTDSLNRFSNQATINDTTISNVFKVNFTQSGQHLSELFVCIKGITPGGRGRPTDEFRIQQNPIHWNTTLELAEQDGTFGVLFGIYKTSDMLDPIFCTWKLRHSSPTGSPKSKQIKSNTISKAILNGFAQSKMRSDDEFVFAFRKEFLFFYLQNASWLHNISIEGLANNGIEEHEVEHEVEHENSPSPPSGINRIYYGAPGTGKSYGIQNFIKENGIHDYSDKESHTNVFRVTLHPEYSYNDFIGQVMPVIKREDDSSTIEYEFVPQIFTKALARAFEKRVDGEPVFLILEEMSRANVAAVFGDLFQLLDRDSDGISEYKIDNALIATIVFGETNSNEKIFLPENLYILGTVNTSDQNVFVMDTAFKRRFEFEYISTDSVIENKNDFSFELTQDDESVIELSWLTLFPKINDFIVKKEEAGGLGLSEDKQLGQFFIKFKKNEDYNSEINDYNLQQIRGKLLQYLWNDVEMVSYSTHRIFKNEISSFGKLYTLATNNKNFFSHEFIQSLQREEV